MENILKAKHAKKEFEETAEEVRGLKSKDEQIQEDQDAVLTLKAGVQVDDTLIRNLDDRVESKFSTVTIEDLQIKHILHEKQIQYDPVKSRVEQHEALSTQHDCQLRDLGSQHRDTQIGNYGGKKKNLYARVLKGDEVFDKGTKGKKMMLNGDQARPVSKQILSDQQAIDHIREDLKSCYKSPSTTPFFPLDEQETIPLQEFYTDVILVHQTEGKSTTKNNREENSRNRNKKQLHSYKQIFLDKRNKRIILTGHPGSGKSTFCRKIVNTWCTKESNKQNTATEGTDQIVNTQNVMQNKKETDQPIPESPEAIADEKNELFISNSCEATAGGDIDPPITDSSECLIVEELDSSVPYSSEVLADEDILLQFNLLFYIYTPKISNEKTLTEVLYNQCLKRESGQLSNILQTQPEKVLIILDGMNDLSNYIPPFLSGLLQKLCHPRITVLMVMRNCTISIPYVQLWSHCDLLLKIQGLSKNSALKFVQNVIYRNTMYNTIERLCLTPEEKDVLSSFRNVPLLLLFLAHVWCQDRCLPKQRQDLYIKILDCLIKSCISKTGNKYISESELIDQYDMNMKTKMFLELYFDSACKVAHHFLLETSVVMQDDVLMNQLGDNAPLKLSALLDCGILSKLDAFSPLEKNVSISFLHLSIHEYLTSMHLVGNEDAFQNFLESLNTLSDVLRYENLFIFICGLDAKKGHMALIKICQVCDKDHLVIKYRQRRDYDGQIRFLVENLNEMYRACLNEMEGQELVEIPDILSFNYECYKFVMSRLRPCCVKSLCMYFIQLDQDDLYLSSLTNLTYLGLIDISMSEKCSRSLCISISSCTHLKSLVLRGKIKLYDGVLNLRSLTDLTYLTLWDVTMSEKCSRSLCSSISECTHLESLELKHIRLHDGVFDLSRLTKLTYLKVWDATMSEKCSRYLYRSISGCAHMKWLVLRDIKLRDPKSRTDLNSQTLQYVTMSEECSRFQCSSISGCTDLKWLLLEDIRIRDGVLDLSRLTCIRSLTLWGIPMSKECSRSMCSSISGCTSMKWLVLRDIKVHDGLLDLSRLTDIRSLTLWGIPMSEECSRSLCSSIRSLCRRDMQFDHLNWLLLRDLQLHDDVLDLNLDNLTFLTLWKISISEKCSRSLCISISGSTCQELLLKDIKLHDGILNLRSLTMLRSFTLWSVTMSDECSRFLFISISCCTYLKWLVLRDIKLHDGVLNLLSLFRLTSLTLWGVTMSEESSRSLCSSMIGCGRMKRLVLRDIKIHDHLLDLSCLTNLILLTLWDVTMSEECSKSLCSSIGGCTHLESLELTKITLHDGVLDLSSLTNLTSLILWKVTMSKECSRSLCKSISNCTHLKWLMLRDIKLHDDVLDLSSLTNLTALTLWDIIVSEGCSRSLCSSITCCTHLERLELRNITLPGGLLPLSSLSNLTSLTLWSVTKSVECSRSLCNSIRGCTHLERLELRNITLSDGVLDLSSPTNLTSLTLWKVIMSKECSTSLCSSISGCTNLKSLVQRNMKLHNVVLDLSGLRDLTFFTLRCLTMSEECSRSLAVSISGSTNLVGLYMEFIQLYDGVIDLTSLSDLTSLTLRYVTLSDECSRSLCSSISGCTHLERLYIESITLYDGVLDLSSLSDLTSLTLRYVTMSEECSRSLCSTISDCTKMKWLDLNDITLDDGVLDLISLTDLKKLKCHNVNMSAECRQRLQESLKHCQKLEEYSMEEL